MPRTRIYARKTADTVRDKDVAGTAGTAIQHILRAVGRALTVAAGTAVIGLALVAIMISLLAFAQGESPGAMLAALLYWLPPLLVVPFLIVALAIPLIAVPVMALLRALHLESARAYAGWGAATGFALAPLVAWGSGPGPPGPVSVACLVYGAVAGTLFHRQFRSSVQEDRAEA